MQPRKTGDFDTRPTVALRLLPVLRERVPWFASAILTELDSAEPMKRLNCAWCGSTRSLKGAQHQPVQRKSGSCRHVIHPLDCRSTRNKVVG
jgi:hypothetical protein